MPSWRPCACLVPALFWLVCLICSFLHTIPSSCIIWVVMRPLWSVQAWYSEGLCTMKTAVVNHVDYCSVCSEVL